MLKIYFPTLDNEEDDEEEEKQKVLTSEYDLPDIPNKLKTYRAHYTKDNGKISWIAKGIKYTKKNILELEEKGNKFLVEANKLLNDKNKKLKKKTYS